MSFQYDSKRSIVTPSTHKTMEKWYQNFVWSKQVAGPWTFYWSLNEYIKTISQKKKHESYLDIFNSLSNLLPFLIFFTQYIETIRHLKINITLWDFTKVLQWGYRKRAPYCNTVIKNFRLGRIFRRQLGVSWFSFNGRVSVHMIGGVKTATWLNHIRAKENISWKIFYQPKLLTWIYIKKEDGECSFFKDVWSTY